MTTTPTIAARRHSGETDRQYFQRRFSLASGRAAETYVRALSAEIGVDEYRDLPAWLQQYYDVDGTRGLATLNDSWRRMTGGAEQPAHHEEG